MIPFTIDQFALFLLVLVRVTSFLMVSPFFSGRNVSAYYKVGIAFFISLMVYVGTPSFSSTPIDSSLVNLLILILKECLTGLLLGFVGAAVFTAIQVAGQLIEVQIGYSIVNVFDPQTGTQNPVLGNLYNMFAMLVFIGLNGPGILLMGLMQSYTFIAAGQFTLNGTLMDVLLKLGSAVLLLGLKLAMPVLGALLLTDVSFAILTRTVPQMNIYVVGMPVKIAIGLLTIILTVPAMVTLFNTLFRYSFQALDSVLHILGGTP